MMVSKSKRRHRSHSDLLAFICAAAVLTIAVCAVALAGTCFAFEPLRT